MLFRSEDLASRVAQHKTGRIPGFTKRYNVCYLIYAEEFESIKVARLRERELKGWKRTKKEALIAKTNPDWKELHP